MPFEVKIPAMGESITSGVLAKWLVREGDSVAKDQPLFELETDKITTEGVAEVAGPISFRVAAGAEVKIGQVVAVIGDGAAATGGASTPPGTALAAGSAGNASADAGPSSAALGLPTSPAVRRLAEESGIDPAGLTGTGKGGRVTKADVLAASKPGGSTPPISGAAPTPVPAAPLPPAADGRQSRRKLSPLRQRLAERLVAAQHQAAMLTTFNEVDMSAVMALRSRYQDEFVKKNGLKLGFMSFFVKAVVHALGQVPAVNCRLEGDTLVQNNYYDIAVAVSTEKGLMVPVVRNCDSLDLAGLEKAVADLAGRAREGRITMADLEGGVFTITNGGVFGSMLSTPILNPPQSAILGMHAINDRAVVVGGQVVVRPVMYLALSYDHRVIDGREAVTFLVKVKQAIEDPARLLLGV